MPSYGKTFCYPSRKYLIYTLISGQLFLAGIIAVYCIAGTVDFKPGGFLTPDMAPKWVLQFIFILMIMAALLNSLQMGFKTLAIQKRSGEVWQLLGAVKTEFDKFGQGLAKMQQRLRQTDEELDQLIGVRSRAISRKLRSVQSLDEASASALLEIDDMNELPKALSETSETSGKVGEY